MANVKFGRGTLSQMPTGVQAQDMLYFATSERAVYLNGALVSGNVLDFEYKVVVSANGEYAEFRDPTNFWYKKESLGATLPSIFSDQIVISGGDPSNPYDWAGATVAKGTYILYRKVENPEDSTRKAKWFGIILTSGEVTPEALQQALQELESEVTDLQRDIATIKMDVSTLKNDSSTLKEDVSALKNDVSTLDASVVSIDTAIRNNFYDKNYIDHNYYNMQAVDAFKNEIDSSITELKADVSTLKNDVSTLDSRIDNVETILEINSSQTSARLDRSDASINALSVRVDRVDTSINALNQGMTTVYNGLNDLDASISYIKNNYIKDISIGAPLEIAYEDKDEVSAEITLNYGTGLTVQNGALIVDTSSNIFDSLGSYKIEKRQDGSWVLTQNGAEITGSAVIEAPEDQFLESVEVSTGTGVYEDTSVLVFKWKLADTSVATPQEVPLSRLFPGIDGKAGEIVVSAPGSGTGSRSNKWEISLDSSVLNRISDISTALSSLEDVVDDIDIPEYTGVNSNGVDVSVNANHEISAAIVWSDFSYTAGQITS